jgi:hypothetical protein
MFTGGALVFVVTVVTAGLFTAAGERVTSAEWTGWPSDEAATGRDHQRPHSAALDASPPAGAQEEVTT